MENPVSESAKALQGAIDLLTKFYESPSLAHTNALVLIDAELPVLRAASRSATPNTSTLHCQAHRNSSARRYRANRRNKLLIKFLQCQRRQSFKYLLLLCVSAKVNS